MCTDGVDAKGGTKEGCGKLVALRNFGIVLIVISFVMLVPMLFVHLLPWNRAGKVAAYAGIYIAADVVFWVGAGLVGTELALKFRRFLNPLNWFRKEEDRSD